MLALAGELDTLRKTLDPASSHGVVTTQKWSAEHAHELLTKALTTHMPNIRITAVIV